MRALLLLLLAAPLSAAVSQASDSLVRPGARLRWTVLDTVDRATGETRFTYREARLDSLDGRSLVLRPVRTTPQLVVAQDTIRAPLTGISIAEALTGSHRHIGSGAFGGLVLGAITGYLFGNPGSSEGTRCVMITDIWFCGVDPARPDTRVKRTTSFGAAGAVAGAIAGYFIRTESWTQVDVAGLRLRLGLQ